MLGSAPCASSDTRAGTLPQPATAACRAPDIEAQAAQPAARYSEAACYYMQYIMYTMQRTIRMASSGGALMAFPSPPSPWWPLGAQGGVWQGRRAIRGHPRRPHHPLPRPGGQGGLAGKGRGGRMLPAVRLCAPGEHQGTGWNAGLWHRGERGSGGRAACRCTFDATRAMHTGMGSRCVCFCRACNWRHSWNLGMQPAQPSMRPPPRQGAHAASGAAAMLTALHACPVGRHVGGQRGSAVHAAGLRAAPRSPNPMRSRAADCAHGMAWCMHAPLVTRCPLLLLLLRYRPTTLS